MTIYMTVHMLLKRRGVVMNSPNVTDVSVTCSYKYMYATIAFITTILYSVDTGTLALYSYF